VDTSDNIWFEVSQEEKRALFFRTLKPGKKERIEFRISDKISGDIRENTTPWYYDDWELKYFIKVDLIKS